MTAAIWFSQFTVVSSQRGATSCDPNRVISAPDDYSNGFGTAAPWNSEGISVELSEAVRALAGRAR